MHCSTKMDFFLHFLHCSLNSQLFHHVCNYGERLNFVWLLVDVLLDMALPQGLLLPFGSLHSTWSLDMDCFVFEKPSKQFLVPRQNQGLFYHCHRLSNRCQMIRWLLSWTLLEYFFAKNPGMSILPIRRPMFSYYVPLWMAPLVIFSSNTAAFLFLNTWIETDLGTRYIHFLMFFLNCSATLITVWIMMKFFRVIKKSECSTRVNFHL